MDLHAGADALKESLSWPSSIHFELGRHLQRPGYSGFTQAVRLGLRMAIRGLLKGLGSMAGMNQKRIFWGSLETGYATNPTANGS